MFLGCFTHFYRIVVGNRKSVEDLLLNIVHVDVVDINRNKWDCLGHQMYTRKLEN